MKGGKLKNIAPVCPYCGRRARLTDARIVYPNRGGEVWVCGGYPDCDSYVGCHPGTTKAVGTLANKALRNARRSAHAALDPLWLGGYMKRGDVYRSLAVAMGMKEEDCHIGYMNESECARAAAAARAMWPKQSQGKGIEDEPSI